ncbi:MAG: NAD-dependent epimerase/dehydratase family protein [Actinomycetota bacterium]|nr:NAD-dependent epimerase/dehydratase family protein [Actinomycetota bacterium]
MSDPRVMVTGGAGFIGSHLVDRLLELGFIVDVIDDLSSGSLLNLTNARQNYLGRLFIHQLDIRSQSLIELTRRRRPSTIFHLAARTDVTASIANPSDDLSVNVSGSIRVLEAALAGEATKVIYATSAAIYGDPSQELLPLDEGTQLRPISPYGASKRAVIDYLEIFRSVYDLEYTALVFANVYGPRQGFRGESGVVSTFAERLLAGRPCQVFGDGTSTRDYVYVTDVVDAMIRAMDSAGGLLVNVGTAVETQINVLFELIARATGSTLGPRMTPRRTGEIQRSSLAIERAKAQLGWKPTVDVHDGVSLLIDWYNSRPVEFINRRSRSK